MVIAQWSQWHYKMALSVGRMWWSESHSRWHVSDSGEVGRQVHWNTAIHCSVDEYTATLKMMVSVTTVPTEGHVTVNIRTDSCNCCDDSRSDSRGDRRVLRPPSRWLTADCGIDTIVVYGVEIRRFATSNGRGDSRCDSLGDLWRCSQHSREWNPLSVTLVAATDILVDDDSRGGCD